MPVSNIYFSSLPSPTESEVTRKKDYQAELFFRNIKSFDLEESREFQLELFKQRFPGYVPEPFRTTNKSRSRRTHEMLRGSVGRLRVLAGQPLERCIIRFKDLPSVSRFERDPDAQFSQQVMDWVKEDLRSIIQGPFVAFVERGWSGTNHAHVFCKQGACQKGARKVVLDKELFAAVRYCLKKPYWTDENALAYLRSANMGKRVGRRVIKYGLGDSRTRVISVSEIEQVLGIELSRAKKLLN